MAKKEMVLDPLKQQKAKKDSPEQVASMKKELLVRLQHLRSLGRDVANTYLANLESDILKIVDELNRNETNGKPRFKARTLKNLVKKLDNLSVKPQKGRRKDLKRIERAVESIQGATLQK